MLTIPDDTDLSHLGGSRCAILKSMLGLRKLLRARRSGSLLALTVAYSLAVRAMMASVGLSMSAPDQGGHVICSFTSGASAHTPATAATVKIPVLSRTARFASSQRRAPSKLRQWARRWRFPPMLGCGSPTKFRSISATKRLFRSFAVRSANRALPRLSPYDARTRSASAEPSLIRLRRKPCAPSRN